ncbi:MAG: amidohydrolase family protein, partial [Anaerolineae bacterium]|nr:amidohydrolase family protein [Anaerolineae bacterium]
YRERYSHSRQWIEEIEARFDDDPALVGPRRQPLADRLLIGAVKNLLSGVTTVCHHNPLFKLLRRRFPIRVVERYGFCHSLFRGDDPVESYQKTKPDRPWIIHLAEGVDSDAAAEFDQLDDLGLLQPNTVLVHGVGLTEAQRQVLIERGGGLIWCPASNDFLFGRTACVSALAEAGKVALGSDSRLSGACDLLAELRVAHQTGQLYPQALFRLVTVDAARLLRLGQKGVGRLVEGGVADLVLLSAPTGHDPFETITGLDRSQIGLVMIGGRPLVGSPALQVVFETTRTRGQLVRVDEVNKFMNQTLVNGLARSSISEPGVNL